MSRCCTADRVPARPGTRKGARPDGTGLSPGLARHRPAAHPPELGGRAFPRLFPQPLSRSSPRSREERHPHGQQGSGETCVVRAKKESRKEMYGNPGQRRVQTMKFIPTGSSGEAEQDGR